MNLIITITFQRYIIVSYISDRVIDMFEFEDESFGYDKKKKYLRMIHHKYDIAPSTR